MAPKTDTAANKDSPQMEEGLDQGREEQRERERGGVEENEKDPKPGAPTGKPPQEGSRPDEGAGAKPDPHRRARGEAEAQQR